MRKILGKYVLDGNGNPVLVRDTIAWAAWYEIADRIVRHDHVDGVLVSTVFLGLDHNFSQEGPPILWETMIFGGEHDQYQRRYSSREAAEVGHMDALGMLDGWSKDMAELERIFNTPEWVKVEV